LPQSLKSLKSLYLHYPELWNKLKQYEKDSPHGFKPNFSLDQFENKVKRELTQTTLLKIEKKMEMHKHSSGIEYVNPLMRDSAIFQKILNLLRIFDFQIFSIYQIAKILNRDDRTIWTVLSRYKEKEYTEGEGME